MPPILPNSTRLSPSFGADFFSEMSINFPTHSMDTFYKSNCIVHDGGGGFLFLTSIISSHKALIVKFSNAQTHKKGGTHKKDWLE